MKLSKGMNLLLANADNVTFAYVTYLRKCDWDSEQQGLKVETLYVHNPLLMPIVDSKICLNSFDRFGIVAASGYIADHNLNRLTNTCLEMSRQIKKLNLLNRTKDAHRIELELFKALEQLPEYSYMR